jgi:hypothetical protein
MPRAQFVAGMPAELVRQFVRIDDPPVHGACVPAPSDRTLGADRLLLDPPEAASIRCVGSGRRIRPLPDQRAGRSADIEIGARRQTVIVVDGRQIGRAQILLVPTVSEQTTCAGPRLSSLGSSILPAANGTQTRRSNAS